MWQDQKTTEPDRGDRADTRLCADVDSVFLVGMPRSGTKLLRSILNQHPGLKICNIETDFFPYWVRHWPGQESLSTYENFCKFHQGCASIPFFVYLAAERGLPGPRQWYENCRNFTPAGVFEGLLRTVLNLSAEGDVIWGDKSPSYIRHLALLQENFPTARFVHIVRDVRDYCVSINRAWGKNMYRAAQRWTDDVDAAIVYGVAHPEVYLQLRYEDLLRNPDLEARRICKFLGLQYVPEIIELERPSENLGEARGRAGILSTNSGRYRERLSLKQLRRIEAIAAASMRRLGYARDTNAKPHRISPLALRWYQIADGFSLIRSRFRDLGMRKSICFYIRYRQISGNRQ